MYSQFCMSSCLSYTACKAHAPYYTAVCGHMNLPHFTTLPHKRHDFRKRKYCT